jgi:hypothetical protein
VQSRSALGASGQAGQGRQFVPRHRSCAILYSLSPVRRLQMSDMRFAAPVFTPQPPVLRNNRKLPGGPRNCPGPHWNFQWPAAVSPPRACFGPRFSKNSLFLRWRPVSLDCIRHHPVSANRRFPIRRQIGRFCGDFRPLNSRILVSAGGRAFWRRFLAPGLCIQKFRSRRPALSAKSKGSIPGFAPQ